MATGKIRYQLDDASINRLIQKGTEACLLYLMAGCGVLCYVHLRAPVPHHLDVTVFREVPPILTTVTAFIAKLRGMCYRSSQT
jgi:hypothetical protein